MLLQAEGSEADNLTETNNNNQADKKIKESLKVEELKSTAKVDNDEEIEVIEANASTLHDSIMQNLEQGKIKAPLNLQKSLNIRSLIFHRL